MNKQGLLWVVRIVTILSAVGVFALTVGKRLLLGWLLRDMGVAHGNASSIGIIGSADGPTAILVSTGRAGWLLPSLIVTTLAGVAALFFIKRSAER